MLVQVRQRFYNHEDFMLELQSHQGAVRKVSVNKFILMILRDSSTVMIFQSVIISREGLILTLSILPCLEGWIS